MLDLNLLYKAEDEYSSSTPQNEVRNMHKRLLMLLETFILLRRCENFNVLLWEVLGSALPLCPSILQSPSSRTDSMSTNAGVWLCWVQTDGPLFDLMLPLILMGLEIERPEFLSALQSFCNSIPHFCPITAPHLSVHPSLCASCVSPHFLIYSFIPALKHHSPCY